MKTIEYISLQDIDRQALLTILNKETLRKHLVAHNAFDDALLDEWIAGKVSVDATEGCRVRGILIDGAVAGWCGIQFENQAYELAIVLDEACWGAGVSVFKDMMAWASALGHSHVVLHLFNTRPEYKFLRKMASRVYESTLFGEQYTSYELSVPDTAQAQ